jgi:hypothetical protein
MDSTPTDRTDARKLTVTAADLAKELTPERRAAIEGAYRRGCHQALAFAADEAHRTRDVSEIRRVLRRAETLAGELRFTKKDQGNGMLLDHIRQRIKMHPDSLHSRQKLGGATA